MKRRPLVFALFLLTVILAVGAAAQSPDAVGSLGPQLGYLAPGIGDILLGTPVGMSLNVWLPACRVARIHLKGSPYFVLSDTEADWARLRTLGCGVPAAMKLNMTVDVAGRLVWGYDADGQPQPFLTDVRCWAQVDPASGLIDYGPIRRGFMFGCTRGCLNCRADHGHRAIPSSGNGEGDGR